MKMGQIMLEEYDKSFLLLIDFSLHWIFIKVLVWKFY